MPRGGGSNAGPPTQPSSHEGRSLNRSQGPETQSPDTQRVRIRQPRGIMGDPFPNPQPRFTDPPVLLYAASLIHSGVFSCAWPGCSTQFR